MTKKLEELFELPQEERDSLHLSIPDNAQEITTEASDALDKIEAALPQVKGLEASDGELDELATLATNSYKDLMDLGMQVDSRFASEIFNSASSFLGHAITSKTAKINKKLKMLDLQMKKVAMDHKIATSKGPEELENTPVGTGQSLDRNELLKMLSTKTDEK
jgi:hypothetical protein